MNKKALATVLVAVLVVSISLGVILYVQNNNNQQQAGPFTVIGTLNYAPGNAIFPGISVRSVSPSLSPSPSSITVAQPVEQGVTINYTVNAFIFLRFTGKFTFPPNSYDDFPLGFAQGDAVKLSGSISYKEHAYFMNVTKIAHYSISNISNGIRIWSYNTGNSVATTPAIVDGFVFVGSSNGDVYALNATNGVQIWNYTTGGGVFSSPAVVGDVVYVGSEDSNVYALNAINGAQIWNYTTKGSVGSSPAIINGVVYVGSDDSSVYALNATAEFGKVR